MLERMSLLAPQWTERAAADVGTTLVEMLAYVADELSYRQDAVATEAYLEHRPSRVSLRRHARLVDYRVHDGCNARAWVQVAVGVAVVVLPAGTTLLSAVPGLPPLIEPSSRRPRGARWRRPRSCSRPSTRPCSTCDLNELPLLDLGRAGVLPAGRLHLGHAPRPPPGAARRRRGRPRRDRVPDDRRARRRGPDAAGRRPARRRDATRPTRPAALFAGGTTDVTEIRWHADDALAFPLCLSVVEGDLRDGEGLGQHRPRRPRRVGDRRPPGCLSPSRPWCGSASTGCPDGRAGRGAAAVPADAAAAPADPRGGGARGRRGGGAAHGGPQRGARHRHVRQPARGRVRHAGPRRCPTTARCVARHRSGRSAPTGMPGCSANAPGCSRCWLESPGAATRARSGPAGRAARPRARRDLRASSRRLGRRRPTCWRSRADRARVHRGDRARRHRLPSLRRRRARSAARHRAPTFVASYRVGNGVAGNVGRDGLAHAVTTVSAVTGVRNPLPAAGGVEPETGDEVRRDAPYAFQVQERAVTEADYAEVSERNPRVQRAAATFRWTGSWHTVFVTADRFGGGVLDAAFETTLRDLARAVPAWPATTSRSTRPSSCRSRSGCTCASCRASCRSDVATEVRARLSDSVLPDGGARPLPPRQPHVRAARLPLRRSCAAVHSVPGVQSVDVRDLPAPARARVERHRRRRAADGPARDRPARQRPELPRARRPRPDLRRWPVSDHDTPDTCGCCSGTTVATPAVIENRPGTQRDRVPVRDARRLPGQHARRALPQEPTRAGRRCGPVIRTTRRSRCSTPGRSPATC